MTRVFGVDYQFQSAGDVVTQGLVHAAATLGLDYAHADVLDPHLAQQLAAHRPDLVIVVHGRRAVQRARQALAGYHTVVWLLDEPYEVDDTARWSSTFDQVCVNDPSSLGRHPHAEILRAAYDPARHYVDASGTPPIYRVGFIGGPNPVRETYLTALAARGVLDYLVGGPWRSAVLERLTVARTCTPTETADRYRQTAIVLNVFRSQHHYNAQQVPATTINPRIVEATACGALVVSQWRSELDTLAPSLVTGRTREECLAHIDRYLADPEARLVRAQACRTELAGETYAARLQTVLALQRAAVSR